MAIRDESLAEQPPSLPGGLPLSRRALCDAVPMLRGAGRAARLRPAAWAVAGAATILVLACAWLTVRVALPGDGLPWLHDAGFSGGITLATPISAEAPLQSGDVVLAVNGLPLDGWLRSGQPRPPLVDGTRLRYQVARDGTERDVTVKLMGHEPVVDALAHEGAVVVCAVALLGLGIFTVVRRPGHPAAQALLLLGSALTAATAVTAVGWEVADLVGAPWLMAVGLAADLAAFGALAAAFAHLALTFPSPPDAIRRRPWVITGLYAIPVLTSVAGGVYAVTGWATLAGLHDHYLVWSGVVTAVAAVAALGVLRTVVSAFKDATVRRQAGLPGLALAVTLVALLVVNLVSADRQSSPWVIVPMLAVLPLAVSAAIVRGEFLDIRATLNRALVYGLLTGLLICFYVAIVTLVGALAQSTGLAATLPATIAVAVAFAPMRVVLQKGVERLLYGDRGDPARVLAALGDRLEAAMPPAAVLAVVTETIATTLRLPYVAIRSLPDGQLVCERGLQDSAVDVIALVHAGEAVGELVVGPRAGQRSFGPKDRIFLSDIARHVAVTVRATALLTEVERSRSRLVIAREEERARLRNDLHDRLGSRLAGLVLRLDTEGRRCVETASADALRRGCAEAEAALLEVRRLARGLRPADLEELGLVAAVEAVVGRLTACDDAGACRGEVVAALHLPALDRDLEAAAYQIVVEAMTNAQRHSGGERVWVRIGVDANAANLTIEVADDGRGLTDVDASGMGLHSMRERAAALGGHLDIRDRAGGGTVVRAALPIS